MALIVDDLRARKERLAAAIQEKNRREERVRLEGSLIEFYKAAWETMDPAPYQHNWHLDAIAEHLEAISYGWIRKCCINLPPRHSKTLLVSVAWNAWSWCKEADERYPLIGPSGRFMCLSYADPLAMDNAVLTRRLVQSPWYQSRWGHRVTTTDDQDAKNKFDTTAGGTRISGSFKGSVTGRGAGVRCFPGHEVVATEHGSVPIATLVRNRTEVRVWSYNTKTGAIELKPITDWHTNSGRPIVRVTLSDGTLMECTPDHKVWTRAGWKQAHNLSSNDVLPTFSRADGRNCCSADAPFLRHRCISRATLADIANGIISKLRHMMAFATPGIAFTPMFGGDIAPGKTCSNQADRLRGNAVSLGQSNRRLHRLNDLNSRLACQPLPSQRAVTLGVSNVLCASAVLKIVKAAVLRVAVFVSDLAMWRRWSRECQENSLMDADLIGVPIASSIEPWVSLAIGRSFNKLGFENANLSIGLDNATAEGSGTAQRGNFVVRETGDRFPTLVEHIGHADQTFCLSVADNSTFCVTVNQVVVHNCYDDPHKMDEVESEVIREQVLRLYDTTLKSRVTDPRISAEVLIAQRGHQNDLSAKFLDTGDVVHLCLPAEYDSTRHCATVLKFDEAGEPEVAWEDPRTEDGQLLWPERFGPKELAVFKKNSYEWSAQWQQAPIPRGGGLFKESWWQVHEVTRKTQTVLHMGRQREVFAGYKFTPEFTPDFVLASLDAALTEKEENSYSALTVWAVFRDAKTKHTRILLVDGWQKHLEMHGDAPERRPDESEGAYVHRAQPKWGLIEWVAYTCQRRKVHTLLIENKSRGHDVNKELRRVFGGREFGIRMVEPKRDKWARAQSVLDIFTDEMVWAPAEIAENGTVQWLDWADLVIRECSAFPHGTHDDMVDSVTQALKYLRDNGFAVRRDEYRDIETARLKDNKVGGSRPALYQV